jgi:membrane protein
MARESRFDLPFLLALLCGLVVVRAIDGPRAKSPGGGATGAFGEVRSSDEPLDVQEMRAQERGRGREATAPTHVPWRGWKDILLRAVSGLSKHRLLAVAAGAAFYELLAIFPGITAFVSTYGLFASGGQIRRHLSLLAEIAPASVLDIIGDQIDRIVAKGAGSLSLTFIFGFALALWSANAGVKAIFDALNVIYDEDEKRGLIRLNLTSIAFTLCVIAFLVLAAAAVVAFPSVLSRMGADSLGQTLISWLRWPLLYLTVTFGLAVLYRFGPSRREAKWRWLTLGSATGALAWLLGSAAFSWYLANVADYNATYGSLGAAIGLMMWLWLSAVVVLLGAQLNAEVEHQTARDTTVGSAERPLGQRQAVMADTVGKARA